MTTGVPERESDLSAALDRLIGRLAEACRAAGRNPADVSLLPVTKFFPASDVEILYRLGRREFGESREQEASTKVESLPHNDIRWHMIGHLQRNKARSVAQWAYAIHSVDSTRLAAALEKAIAVEMDSGGARSEPLRVLLQVSLDDDPNRGGVSTADLPALAEQVSAAAHLELSGIMAIPPLDVEAEQAFARLAQIHEGLKREYPGATDLSAGMSNDLEIAVNYGSTCVRVGTALMGARPIASH